MSEGKHEPRPWNGGNILIRRDGQPPILYIYKVDWDDILLAPKESDLMFIGSGIDEIWKTEREPKTRILRVGDRWRLWGIMRKQ